MNMSRTTLTFPTGLLEELVRLSGAKTKTGAVTQAVQDQLQRMRIERVKKAAGTVQFTMTADEMRHGDDRLG